MTAPSTPTQASGHAQLRLTSTALELQRVRITDPDVLAGARAVLDRPGGDLNTWLQSSLQIGAAAINAAGTGGDLLRLQQALDLAALDVGAHVQAGISRLEAAVTAAVDPTSGQLAAASQAAVTRLADGVSRLLTGPGATVPATVQAAVRAVTDNALAEISRSLAATAAATQTAISTDRETVRRDVIAAVASQYGQLGSALQQIRADVAIRTVAIEARSHSSAKGTDYEIACLATLGTVAARAGDGGATSVAKAKGADGTMVGDLVVELTSIGTPAPILVIECKNNQANVLSLADWRSQLASGRSNRRGLVALGMCPPASMPVPGQRLIALDQRTLIIAHDPAVDGPGDPVLAAAYLLLRLTATTIQLDQRDDIDIADAQRQLADLRHALHPISTLDKEIGKINKSADTIRTTAEALRQDLIARMQLLQTTLTA